MNEGTDGISDAILRRDDWARLIRKPLKAKGHALLDVCSPEGNIQRKVDDLVARVDYYRRMRTISEVHDGS